jgi:hypothetical protein
MLISDRAFSKIGVVIGLMGLLLAYYFYRQSIQVRMPTFLVDPVRAKVIDSSGPKISDLSVLYRGKPVGDRDVVAVRVYFWNAGRMPIRKSDVLKPVECVLADGAEILDGRLLKSSRDITGLRLSAAPEGPSNRLTVDFDILEENDGGAIQLVYAGPSDARVHFEGVLVGAPQVIVKNVRDPRRGTERLDRFLGGVGRVVLAFGLLMSVVAVYFWIRRGPPRDRESAYGLMGHRNFRPILFSVTALLYLFTGFLTTYYKPTVVNNVPSSIQVTGK